MRYNYGRLPQTKNNNSLLSSTVLYLTYGMGTIMLTPLELKRLSQRTKSRGRSRSQATPCQTSPVTRQRKHKHDVVEHQHKRKKAYEAIQLVKFHPPTPSSLFTQHSASSDASRCKSIWYRYAAGTSSELISWGKASSQSGRRGYRLFLQGHSGKLASLFVSRSSATKPPVATLQPH